MTSSTKAIAELVRKYAKACTIPLTIHELIRMNEGRFPFIAVGNNKIYILVTGGYYKDYTFKKLSREAEVILFRDDLGGVSYSPENLMGEDFEELFTQHNIPMEFLDSPVWRLF